MSRLGGLGISIAVLLAACSANPGDPSNGPDDVATDADTSDVDGSDSDATDGDATDEDPLGDPNPTDDDPSSVLADLLGVYTLAGSEPAYGAYTGEVELRAGDTLDTLHVTHTRVWTDARFEGQRIAQVWEGSLDEALALHASLAARRFVRAYDGLTRGDGAESVALSGALTRGEGDALTASFTVGASGAHQETWTRVGANGAQPLWTNERRTVPSHDPPSTATRDTLFDSYETFHALPNVAPYTTRPEFQAAVHAFIVDPTDFVFLRTHPDTVRVIQGVVDVISLAEARLRNRGYAHTLAAKAAAFDTRAPVYHLSSAGFFSDWHGTDADGAHDHSGDGLLWSGMYLASQAMRYFVTGSTDALDNVRRVLDAMFACHAATGDPAQFCRTMRAHLDDGSPSWQRGVAPYEHLDWMPGGNNDMAHGLEIGFAYGWLALEAAGGDAAREQRIRETVDSLLTHSNVVKDGSGNQMRWSLLLYALTDDFSDRIQYETRFAILEPFVIGEGNGVNYGDHVLVDASGNHLNLLGLLVPYVLTKAIGHGHEDDYREGLRNYFDVLARVRFGLHQLVSGVIGYDTPPAGALDAIWRLHEYPLRKQELDIDHRIDSAWCMSPWPKFPWKNDWLEDDRTQGLYGFPLFERNLDVSYQWKSDAMWYRGGPSPQVGGNADFLFAYWFGRYTGVITPEM